MLELKDNRQKKSRRFKGWTALVLAATIAVHPLFTPPTLQAASAADSQVTIVTQDPLTYGAILRKYVWSFDRAKKPVTVKANVVEVDLQNPYVKLDTIVGTGGKYTKKQSVRKMANETEATAAVNGDFFNMQADGVPMGPQIMDGKLQSTTIDMPGWYSFALTKENKPVIDLFAFQGKMIARDGASYPLGGINKTYYWYEDDGIHQEGVHSLIDGLYMYTSSWGDVNRSNDGTTVPTEVLVRNGRVVEIKPTGILDMMPPEDGYILRASGKADEFVRQHLKVGDPIVADYKMFAQDPSNSYDVGGFKTMIGGHTILVDQGQPTTFSRGGVSENANRARTAIGYSKDERYAYLITLDESSSSAGATLAELQQLMIKIGVWKGMNLDGGGSTQLVTRKLGDFHTTLLTEVGYERPVVNGIGVYSLSPEGEAKGMSLQGPTALFIGQKATYGIEKAYDVFYNPLDPERLSPIWTASQPIGTFEGSTFTAKATGKATLTAKVGQAAESLDIEVIGGEDIASLKIDASSTALLRNSIYKMTVKATSKSGKTGSVPADALQWEFIGFKGRMEGDRLTVDSIDPNVKEGRMIARYDGFSAMLTLPIADQRIVESFEGATPISFSSTEGVTGTVYKVTEGAGASANKVLALQYDFTQGTKTTVAYATFMGGLKIEGSPESLSLKVKGDNSRNWIRAEIQDSSGGLPKLISLTENTDFSDWKVVSADLKKHNLTYPITVNRIYVANPENGHSGRGLKGQILFDDFTFHYSNQTEPSKNTVKLTIDQKSLTVNGAGIQLDQAPVIVEGNTLVPVRFVVEAMGGKLTWVDEERKVVIMKDNHLIELWLDKKDLIADGERITAEVPPVLMTERTMVPLRIIAENMGWKVTWDEMTRSVTLQ
ncbi:stalk domain-containing protein [Paenibacillus sp. GYB004]|uniref:stalk domain-containing protein n=1 Tax=Paenibacillus sp. GYB004 TaxID=2994393 RepID=UPI002F96C80D